MISWRQQWPQVGERSNASPTRREGLNDSNPRLVNAYAWEVGERPTRRRSTGRQPAWLPEEEPAFPRLPFLRRTQSHPGDRRRPGQAGGGGRRRRTPRRGRGGSGPKLGPWCGAAPPWRPYPRRSPAASAAGRRGNRNLEGV